jgi:hypothetical protein
MSRKCWLVCRPCTGNCKCRQLTCSFTPSLGTPSKGQCPSWIPSKRMGQGGGRRSSCPIAIGGHTRVCLSPVFIHLLLRRWWTRTPGIKGNRRPWLLETHVANSWRGDPSLESNQTSTQSKTRCADCICYRSENSNSMCIYH